MTRISGPWLASDETQSVLMMLENAQAKALVVGGCVRNALLGLPATDVDIATDANPQHVSQLASAKGFKVVPTGIDHGTVTVVVDKCAYEITTFRKDAETDGRHAIVRFTDSVAEDAARRDFTMNALYARRDGSLIDPLSGYDDVINRRVRFIGDAGERIREDYLRSLRFFRFHAMYGDPAAGLDPDALGGIADNLEGVANLSRERIGSEMLKLLGAPDPAPSVAAMRQVGLLRLCLPGASDEALAVLVMLESEWDQPPNALRRLALLGGQNPTMALRLSRTETRQLGKLRDGLSGTQGPGELAYLFGRADAWSICLLRSAATGAPLPRDASASIEKGASARFPVRPDDLMPDYRGPELGRRLKTLERAWIDSGFTMDKSALMAL